MVEGYIIWYDKVNMKNEILSKPIPRTRSQALIVFSRIASFVFHPLFMASLAAFIIYKLWREEFSDKSLPSFQHWFDNVLLFTILLPFASILIFRISGLVLNARMHQPRDRILPLLATMVFYFSIYILFSLSHRIPSLVCSLLLGSFSAIVIIFIVNLFYKVSVHTSAAAILISISVILLPNEKIAIFLFSMMWLVAITVGIVRWLLGAHTIGQILFGYVIGIATQFIAWFIFYA